MKVAKNLRRISEESLPYTSPGSVSIKKEGDHDDMPGDDNEKRRRRRLRNKIAAEKCRNKRKKAIEKLYSESEVVAIQNARFKEDIQRLEAEHRYIYIKLELGAIVWPNKLSVHYQNNLHPSDFRQTDMQLYLEGSSYTMMIWNFCLVININYSGNY